MALAMAADTAPSSGSASPNSYPYAVALAMAATTARPCASAIALQFKASSRRFPNALDRLADVVRMEWAASSRQGRSVQGHDGKRKRLS